MPNITLSVDAETIRRVRHLALDRHTTLTAMVREYLTAAAAQEAGEREQAAAELRETFAKYAVKMGRRTRNVEFRMSRRADTAEIGSALPNF